ncbi:hypothetical protein N657DRAFT_333283 [Parathielavia appendiculata]|uniref:Uncharacterized protein n=1 Tax=Parathielavia appendiculata TaxID=2587402 RepID=A0AAN6Z5D8_9PEZI|nr:hypothetical protein N657DRAFT_333283 [Parathielavia appendiculata]
MIPHKSVGSPIRQTHRPALRYLRAAETRMNYCQSRPISWFRILLSPKSKRPPKAPGLVVDRGICHACPVFPPPGRDRLTWKVPNKRHLGRRARSDMGKADYLFRREGWSESWLRCSPNPCGPLARQPFSAAYEENPSLRPRRRPKWLSTQSPSVSAEAECGNP